MKKIYTCDICGETIHDPKECFGLHFKTHREFIFGLSGCSDGKHICFHCAVQFKKRLEGTETSKILETYQNEKNN